MLTTKNSKEAFYFSRYYNGNLTKDSIKGISNISWNSLNLPNVVSFTDGSTVTYLYAADGTKLRTLHNINGAATQKDYCGSVIYENGTAKLWQTEAGYISMNDSKYHYYLQDHQGNNRVVVNETRATEEVNHYYAFGGLFDCSNSVQPFKYNGKELDTKKGLNWYDYGARQYDASLGRFITQDRFTEKYSALSPYQYGANNPACNMDVNGDSIVVLKDKLHLGLLIQNENNKWAYYSFNGVKAYESTNEKFGAPRDNKGEMIWNTPQEFLDSDYNNLNEEGNNGYGYQKGFLIPTNSEQDNIVKETFLQAVGQGYSLINNHCSIAVQKSLKAIGLKTRLKIGYLPFVASPISTIRINRDPYLPNETYIVIKMKNRGYVIKKMTMNIKANYITTIWWLLQAIIVVSSCTNLVLWIVEFFVCMVSLISVLTNSLKIKVVSYLLLVGYSIAISYLIGLLWLFFVCHFFDTRTFMLLIPLLNLYFSLKYCKFYFKNYRINRL